MRASISRTQRSPPKAASEAPTAEKPLHPKAIEMLEVVKRMKHATQTDVHEALGIERSAVQNLADGLLKRGLIKAEYVVPPKGHRHIVYHRPDLFSVRGQ